MASRRLSPTTDKAFKTERFHNHLERCTVAGVPALFYYREKRGKKPVVFMQHSAHFLKEELAIWCHRLAHKGYFVVAVDAVHHGERVHPEVERLFADHFTELLRDVTIGTARDIGAVIDHLAARRDVDTSRIGMIGFSMGGWVTWAALALERRITAAVCVVSTGNLVGLAKDRLARQKTRGRAFKQALKELRQVDASLSPEKVATRPILVLSGGDDHPMVDHMALTEAAVRPACETRGIAYKSIVFPGVAHKFTPEMEAHIAPWLARYLK